MTTTTQSPGILLTIAEVTAELKVGRSFIYKRIKTGEFPKPIHLSPKATRWRRRDIEEWIDQRAETA